MKTRNKCSGPVTVEVLGPDEIKTRCPHTQADALDLLVQQKVAEVLAARDEFIFEPWFRTRQVAYEIRRLQTVPERTRWSRYFERHGCISCHKQSQPHASIGFCSPCYNRVFQQLKKIDLELMQGRPEEDYAARHYLRSLQHSE
jgi:hypothetical protein